MNPTNVIASDSAIVATPEAIETPAVPVMPIRLLLVDTPDPMFESWVPMVVLLFDVVFEVSASLPDASFGSGIKLLAARNAFCGMG